MTRSPEIQSAPQKSTATLVWDGFRKNLVLCCLLFAAVAIFAPASYLHERNAFQRNQIANREFSLRLCQLYQSSYRMEACRGGDRDDECTCCVDITDTSKEFIVYCNNDLEWSRTNHVNNAASFKPGVIGAILALIILGGIIAVCFGRARSRTA